MPFIHQAVFGVVHRSANVAVGAFCDNLVIFIARGDRYIGNDAVRRFLADFFQPANATVLQQRVSGTVRRVAVLHAVKANHDAVKRHLAGHSLTDQRLELRHVGPRIKLFITDAVVIVDLAAHVVERLH